ncbi:Tyrosine recombinase XerC [Corynebacterium diphtheriae]|nr:Tyrosine recombinase XerC [Corynebacterium diphtheriae]CAB0925901.1 Tyrosine recombinase XerC [Corynebacterium diphtheriae]
MRRVRPDKEEVYLMAYVRDLWMKKNPDKTSRIKKVRSARWGKGKRWQAVWVENGNEITRSFDNKDAAELYAARAEVGQADGTWITKDKLEITLEDMWDVWIASKEGRASSTKTGYEAAWKHIKPVFGSVPCWKIERAKVAAWIPTVTTKSSKNKEPRIIGSGSQRKIGIVIRALLDQAEDLEIIGKNKIRSNDIPRQSKAERRYLTVREIDRLLLAARAMPEVSLMINVLLFTGLRPGEAKGLKVKDFDPLRGRLYIRRDVDDLGRPDETKTRNHRDVPIGGDLLFDLEDAAENKNPNDWLLTDEIGHVWTSTKWRRRWHTVCDNAHISKLKTYELRHTAASLAIAAGADVKTVQLMLGHASAAMTLDVYAHLWETGLDYVPGAMSTHMQRERERLAERERRRSERGLRAI